MKLKKIWASLVLTAMCLCIFGTGLCEEKPAPVLVENMTIDVEAIASREWLPEYNHLVETALVMRNEYSYAPYSHYQVGAALLGQDGKVYTGCNVEECFLSRRNLCRAHGFCQGRQ